MCEDAVTFTSGDGDVVHSRDACPIADWFQKRAKYCHRYASTSKSSGAGPSKNGSGPVVYSERRARKQLETKNEKEGAVVCCKSVLVRDR